MVLGLNFLSFPCSFSVSSLCVCLILSLTKSISFKNPCFTLTFYLWQRQCLKVLGNVGQQLYRWQFSKFFNFHASKGSYTMKGFLGLWKLTKQLLPLLQLFLCKSKFNCSICRKFAIFDVWFLKFNQRTLFTKKSTANLEPWPIPTSLVSSSN